LGACSEGGVELGAIVQEPPADQHVAAKAAAQLGDRSPGFAAARAHGQDGQGYGQERVAYFEQHIERGAAAHDGQEAGLLQSKRKRSRCHPYLKKEPWNR
jgi:hypothetical protein